MTETQTVLDDYQNSTETDTYTIELNTQMDTFEYEDACRLLTDALDTLSDSNQYHSEGSNIGWKNQNGTCDVELEDGQDLVTKLTPNGSWNMEIEAHPGVLFITLSHHDSPMGETHEIYPA